MAAKDLRVNHLIVEAMSRPGAPSRKQLADATDSSEPTVSRWLSYENTPSIEMRRRIETVLGVKLPGVGASGDATLNFAPKFADVFK